MGAKKDFAADFISGIYNYCDRWCEKCPLTHRCLLFHQQAEMRSRHLEAGEDPEDWDVVLKDVGDNLREAAEGFVKLAEERGIDLKQIVEDDEEEYKSQDFKDHPLRKKAHKFAMDSHHFLEKLSTLLHEEQRKAISVEQLDDLQECFETLSWYHMQIAVKIDRALSGRASSAKFAEEYGPGFLNDSDGSAKVAYLGIIRCMDALTKVYQWNQPFHLDIMPLLEMLHELAEEVDESFPAHKTFKRPGFDD
jgi:hypothetical protein